MAEEVKPQSKKWTLFPAWSFVAGIVLMTLYYLSDGGVKFKYMLSFPQGVGGIIGEFFGIPIWWTIIAVIRNLFVKYGLGWETAD
jgi:hypothetical protein